MAALLAELRPMDLAGARAVVENDPELSKLLEEAETVAGRVDEIAWRLDELARAQYCLACGTCCRRSSPTLYQEDADLVEKGLDREKLFALRQGERVGSARLGKSGLLETDLVKLRETPGGGCVYLVDNMCSVYEHRPLQCRHLECWSEAHAGQLADKPRLDPLELFRGDEMALELAREYVLKLPAEKVTQTLESAAAGDAQALKEAQAFLELDLKLRGGITQQYCYSQTDLDLLLGRPVWEVALAYGFELEQGKDRMLRLKPLL